MTDPLLPIWLIIAGVSVIALLDWLGRRKARQSRHVRHHERSDRPKQSERLMSGLLPDLPRHLRQP